MAQTENCLKHAHLPNPEVKVLCVQCLAEVQSSLAETLAEAVALLSDYVRIYPDNSGRAIHFLQQQEVSHCPHGYEWSCADAVPVEEKGEGG